MASQAMSQSSLFSTEFAPTYTEDKLKGIFHREMFQRYISPEDENILKQTFDENYGKITTQDQFQTISRKLNYKFQKEHFIKGYRTLRKKQLIQRDVELERIMVRKAPRGHSGVEVVTIFTGPGTFSCPKNCHYCPLERDANGVQTQPRSYLSTEPGNMRATQNLHHPVGQTFDRIFALQEIGHIPDTPENPSKLEFIISGGTFNFYPEDYLVWFVTCMYYACNVYYDYIDNDYNIPRDILTLEEEQKINETSALRVIGLTIETRPDYLDPRDYDKKLAHIPDSDERVYTNLKFFRKLGVTRVQIGVQHTNDEILKLVNRECTNELNKKAIKFLKQNGFKVDIHLMLDLPGSTPNEDMIMLNEVLSNPEYESDQWKIYPTEVTDFSEIKKWYDTGKYKPYAETNLDDLVEVIIEAKKLMKPWIRINRVIRDIPPISIEGGVSCPDLRHQIEKKMRKQNLYCKCIRCREVKMKKILNSDIEMKVRHYEGSYGDEYFISYETYDEKTLMGYIRLRLNRDYSDTMPELHGCAFIRELHVLGNHTTVGTSDGKIAQHRGFGKNLVQKAEEIAIEHGYTKMAIISGIGVREYYKKFGYHEESTYMMKELIQNTIVSEPNLNTSYIPTTLLYCLLIMTTVVLIILTNFIY